MDFKTRNSPNAINTNASGNFYTQKLNDEERVEPCSVIYELFDFAEFSRIQEYHWEYFKTTVTGSFNKELTRKERNSIVYYHEKIGRLIEAAHLINEQYKKRRRFRMGYNNTQGILGHHGKTVNEKIVELIVEIARPEKVYQLDSYNANLEGSVVMHSYLIVLRVESMFSNEMKVDIESACLEYATVIISFINRSDLVKITEQGHAFYSQVCVSENIIYEYATTSQAISIENPVNIKLNNTISHP